MRPEIIIPVLDQPAASQLGVARKLLRYLRLDDSRHVIDWQKVEGGEHRMTVCDIAENLLTEDYPAVRPGSGDLGLLVRRYEEAMRTSHAAAVEMDRLASVTPSASADMAALESLLMEAGSVAAPYADLAPAIAASLEDVSRRFDAAEEEAGILPLRRRMEEEAAIADELRRRIGETPMDSLAAVAARLRVLACDRLLGDRDPDSPERSQLAAAISDLERMAGLHGDGLAAA